MHRADPLQRNLRDQARVEPIARLFLHERSAVRHGATGQRAATPILGHRAKRQQRPCPIAALPEQPGTEREAVVSGHVVPAVIIEILTALPVRAASDRHAPVVGQRRCDIGGRVLSVAAGGVEQQFGLHGIARTARHQIDDTAQCRCAIERRRRALDHLDPAKIGRRYLQQTDRRGRPAEQRQPIGEQLRIAPVEPAHSDIGGAECG